MMDKRSNTAQVQMYLLRPFHIEQQGNPIYLPTRKTESLLAYLVLHPGFHSREKLATLFWADSSNASARGSLRKALTFIRKHLGNEIRIADREQVQLNPDCDLYCDAAEFGRQAARFLALENPDIQEMDFDLYQNELLTDFYDEWILEEREHYNQLYIKVLLRAIEVLRAQSEYSTAIQYAKKLLIHDSTNEPAYQHLIFCHIASGDRYEAIQQYETCRKVLETELGVKPARETRALYDWITQSSDIRSLAARVTNLPIPISSFVGRVRELAEIKQSLSTARLITLTGVGGSGKTRLAIRVATELIDSFHDGVWWVDFSSLSNAALVPQSAAKSLGVRESQQQTLTESIVGFIHKKKLLLVLDNCEHLVEACAQISNDLLTQCPHLKILATSREPLRVDGEGVYNVPTLPIPQIDKLSIVDLLLEYESVKLFVARARAIQTSFVLDDRTALLVAQICRHLDGIPLAIELAAARVKTMSLEQILPNLDDAFRLLIGGSRAVLPRQQTLRAMIDWSYDLLRKKEQLLFRRISVFAGGCTLEAAAQVCAEDGFGAYDVLDLLTNLVSKSLVVVTEQSNQKETRYYMLDTIHKYAREKLVDSGEAERIQTRHLDFFVKFTEEAGSKLRGPEQLEALNRLETEYANIRTALEQSSLSGNANAGLQIAWSLMMFWSGRGYWSEARRILTQLLAQPAAIGDTALRVKGLIISGLVTTLLNDREAAQPAFEESIKIAGDLGPENKNLLAFALGLRGYSLMNSDLSLAQSLCEQALEISRQIDDKDFMANVLDYLGNIYAAQGNYSMAVTASTESKDGFLALKNRWLASRPLGNLGSISFQQGDYDSAHSHWEAALAIYQEMGDKANTAFMLGELAKIALIQGNYKHSAALYEESLVILRAVGDAFSISSLLPHLGHIWLQEGNKERASTLFIDGLILNKKFEHRTYISLCLAGLAALALPNQQHQLAAQLLGLAETVMPDYQEGIFPFVRAEIEGVIESVRSVLGESNFIKAWEDGKALTIERAIEYALEMG